MAIASRIGPSVFLVCALMLLRKIFEVPKPSRNRPGPAASCTTRASIATCTGCRVNGEMIPQPIVSRSVSRAISADTTVDERASIPCFRHHGYASASQIVSIPALVHDPRRLEHLLERLHRELHHPDPKRRRHAA